MRGARANGAAGFTLMEMLVTLVIFSVVTALIWQALATLSRIEMRLNDSQLFASEDALRSQWVRQSLFGLMNGPVADPFHFTGTSRGLEAYTTMPPWPGSLGPERFQLVLQEESSGATVLLARRSMTKAQWRLWSWQGPAAFSYLDEGGRWLAQWPPPLGEPPPMPLAVRLVAPEGWVLVVPVLSGDTTLLLRSYVEGSG
jgi:prepilin-type N-terminal cleavage/methylation domain-containing protein